MCQVGFFSLGVIIMPQSHTAGKECHRTESRVRFSYTHTYIDTDMIQQYERVGNNGKTLTVTEHMMARLIVHAWQMMAMTRQLYPYFCS